MVRKMVTREKALERLELLCNRSEQCEYELNRKMLNWGISSSDRKSIIQSLRESRLVDDSRYSKAYANDKARFSFWGPQKIRMELMKRHIQSSLVSEAIKNVDSQVWKEGLLRNAGSKSKKLDLIGEKGWDNRQMLFRYLISRGFPSSAVSKVIELIKKRQEEGK